MRYLIHIHCHIIIFIGVVGVGTDNRSTSKLSGENSHDNEEELSEEEKWLNALEKGTLNSYGEIGTAKKDPAQLTARQVQP